MTPLDFNSRSLDMISLQFYTVRDAFAADPIGTLERVAQIGYPGIEIGAKNSDAVIAKIKDLGLSVVSAGVGIEALRDDFEGTVEGAKALDTSFLMMGYVGEEYRGSAEKWRQTAAMLEKFGRKAHEAGLTLCYHNHDFELKENFDGKTGLEILFENADPRYLQAELDVYWIQKGGGSPVEIIRRYANRLPLLHCKDMMPDGTFGEVGEGILDWPAIFEAARQTKVLHYVVEQDQCPGDPFDSIATSLANLKKMGIS